MELSPRLRKIADSINGAAMVADIGSDHAYLPICLVREGRTRQAIASDISRGPVELSKRRLLQHNTEASVEVRMGDGLETLKPGEAEIIVIAGMGGLNIRDILEKDIATAKSARLLVLQPMRDSDKLRLWLCGNGFEILDEELVEEEYRIYEILWVRAGGCKAGDKDPMLIGRRVLEKRHPLAAALIDKRVKELRDIIRDLEGKNTAGSMEKLDECLKLLEYYKEVRQWVQ